MENSWKNFMISLASNPIIAILAALATLATVFFASIEIAEIFFDAEVINSPWWLPAKSAFALLLTANVIGIFYFLYRRAHGKNNYLIADAARIFHRELADTHVLRIFASKGTTAKELLLGTLRSGTCGVRPLTVRVLLRDDGSSTRQAELAGEMERWRLDVVSAYSSKDKNIDIKFAFYSSAIMLAGYIFDDRLALLAWYMRGSGLKRSPVDLPFFTLQNNSLEGKKLLACAKMTFDCHFDKAEIKP